MSEFSHYDGCKHNDPDNCGGCALITGGPEGPNYAGWPLAYIRAQRPIPEKWIIAFAKQLQSENQAYVNELILEINKNGISFSKFIF